MSSFETRAPFAMLGVTDPTASLNAIRKQFRHKSSILTRSQCMREKQQLKHFRRWLAFTMIFKGIVSGTKSNSVFSLAFKYTVLRFAKQLVDWAEKKYSNPVVERMTYSFSVMRSQYDRGRDQHLLTPQWDKLFHKLPWVLLNFEFTSEKTIETPTCRWCQLVRYPSN